MTTFTYEAIDEKGLKVSGVIEADSVSLAENMLVSKGLIPSRVAEGKQGNVKVEPVKDIEGNLWK